MVRVFITAYPWDLIDEDLGAVLDRLHGEVGVTGVSVWAGCPPLTQLRVRAVEPRVFTTRGGLFFHPSDERYAGTRCKPVVSSWLKGRDPLARIADACAERGLELSVIVSAAATGRLAQSHAAMACKNALGTVSRMSVCLANPDVQTYLCSLVADLSSNYRLAGVSVTDFVIAWFEALYGDLRVAVPLGETERSLLAACFCESCHQKATAVGVDVAAAQRSVQIVLQRSFDEGAATNQQFAVLLADNAPLAAYYRRRGDELSSLLKNLVEVCECDLLLDREPDAPAREQHVGLDFGIPAAVITRLRHGDEPASALCPSAQRSELHLAESFAIGAHGPELVSLLSQAAGQGFSAARIDNYGLLPETGLTAIKQAIRYARRSAHE